MDHNGICWRCEGKIWMKFVKRENEMQVQLYTPVGSGYITVLKPVSNIIRNRHCVLRSDKSWGWFPISAISGAKIENESRYIGGYLPIAVFRISDKFWNVSSTCIPCGKEGLLYMEETRD